MVRPSAMLTQDQLNPPEPTADGSSWCDRERARAQGLTMAARKWSRHSRWSGGEAARASRTLGAQRSTGDGKKSSERWCECLCEMSFFDVSREWFDATVYTIVRAMCDSVYTSEVCARSGTARLHGEQHSRPRYTTNALWKIFSDNTLTHNGNERSRKKDTYRRLQL